MRFELLCTFVFFVAIEFLCLFVFFVATYHTFQSRLVLYSHQKPDLGMATKRHEEAAHTRMDAFRILVSLRVFRGHMTNYAAGFSYFLLVAEFAGIPTISSWASIGILANSATIRSMLGLHRNSCEFRYDSSDSRNSNKWLRLGGSGSCHCYRLLVLAMQA